jgi:hypothetical protein
VVWSAFSSDKNWGKTVKIEVTVKDTGTVEGPGVRVIEVGTVKLSSVNFLSFQVIQELTRTGTYDCCS